MAEPLSYRPCCGRPSPWGTLCPLPIGHKSAHEWRFRAAPRDDEHWHDEPGWEQDCHRCHAEGYGDIHACEDCREERREVFDIAGRHL